MKRMSAIKLRNLILETLLNENITDQVKAIQKLVGVEEDGKWGSGTQRAWGEWLKTQDASTVKDLTGASIEDLAGKDGWKKQDKYRQSIAGVTDFLAAIKERGKVSAEDKRAFEELLKGIEADDSDKESDPNAPESEKEASKKDKKKGPKLKRIKIRGSQPSSSEMVNIFNISSDLYQSQYSGAVIYGPNETFPNLGKNQAGGKLVTFDVTQPGFNVSKLVGAARKRLDQYVGKTKIDKKFYVPLKNALIASLRTGMLPVSGPDFEQGASNNGELLKIRVLDADDTKDYDATLKEKFGMTRKNLEVHYTYSRTGPDYQVSLFKLKNIFYSDKHGFVAARVIEEKPAGQQQDDTFDLGESKQLSRSLIRNLILKEIRKIGEL